MCTPRCRNLLREEVVPQGQIRAESKIVEAANWRRAGARQAQKRLEPARKSSRDPLSHAETIQKSDRNAIVAAVAVSSRSIELSALIVKFDEADPPTSLESKIQPATAHQSIGIIPPAERIESALAFEVETVEAATEEYVAPRSNFVIVAERINLRAEHYRINLSVPVFAAQVISPRKIRAETQPMKKAVVRIGIKAQHVQPRVVWGSGRREVRERTEQETSAKLQPALGGRLLEYAPTVFFLLREGRRTKNG